MVMKLEKRLSLNAENKSLQKLREDRITWSCVEKSENDIDEKSEMNITCDHAVLQQLNAELGKLCSDLSNSG